MNMGIIWVVLFVGVMGCAADSADGAISDTDIGGVGSDTDSDADSDADSDTDSDTHREIDTNGGEENDGSGECPMGKAYGSFSVVMSESYSSVDGEVANGLRPIEMPQLIGEQEDCVLLRRVNPICDVTCETGDTCGFDGECIEQPTTQDAGIVRIEGMASVVTMAPIQPGNRYFDTTISHPPFASGDPLHLTSTDGYAGVLDLWATGVAPLEILDEQWLIEEGKALNVTWNDGQQTDAEVILTFDVNQHGVSPLFVRCKFEDKGKGVVPPEIIDQLLTLDESAVSGFPNGTLVRRTIDSGPLPSGDGCVAFSAVSAVEATVRVSGYVPCLSNRDCQGGMSCNTQINLCE